MGNSFCDNHYSIPGDPTLNCFLQRRAYMRKLVHTKCDKTRENAEECSFLEQNQPKFTPKTKYVRGPWAGASS